MAVVKRKTGINNIGELPWGSHISVFYGTKQDLITTLVTYLKAGLENNEFCCLISPEPKDIKKSIQSKKKITIDFSHYLKTKQLNIIPHTGVYLHNAVFNQSKTMIYLGNMFKTALEDGYIGMRIAADLDWLEKQDWEAFRRYENEANQYIGTANLLALCAYPLASCGASQFGDITSSHPYSFIVQNDEWLVLRPKSLEEMSQPAVIKDSGTLTPLQSRFAVSGITDLDDAEAVELVLSLCPFCNNLNILTGLIKEFRNIRGLLSASHEELKQAGLDMRCIAFIKLLREIPTEVLREKIKEKPVYESAQDIFDFLYYSMRDLKKEVLKVIHLNSRNQIIDTVDLIEGAPDKIYVNAREVVESAIQYDAKSLIFVHNHPSGDPTPSKDDIRLTRDLVFVGNILQIRVLDHIIIGENSYHSLAAEGLIEEFEMDFLNLRLKGALRNRPAREKEKD